MSEMTTASQVSAINDAPKSDKSMWATVGFGFLGALAMTSCCILPLALVSVGISGVFIGKLGELSQYHYYFLTFAVASLTYGFWKAYRPVSAEACADGTCARPMNRTVMRSLLGLALAIVVGAEVFWYVAPSLLSPF